MLARAAIAVRARIDRDELLDAAADVARNLRAHDSYRSSQRRALAALKKRRPGFSQPEYETALTDAIALFDNAQGVVKEHLASLVAPGGTRDDLVDECARMLASRNPGFPLRTYSWLVSWVYLYYHEM